MRSLSLFCSETWQSWPNNTYTRCTNHQKRTGMRLRRLHVSHAKFTLSARHAQPANRQRNMHRAVQHHNTARVRSLFAGRLIDAARLRFGAGGARLTRWRCQINIAYFFFVCSFGGSQQASANRVHMHCANLICESRRKREMMTTALMCISKVFIL